MNISKLITLTLILLFSVSFQAMAQRKDTRKDIGNVVPRPSKTTIHKNRPPFVINGYTSIVYQDYEVEDIATYFSSKMSWPIGYEMKPTNQVIVTGNIYLILNASASDHPEGYTIDVSETGDSISVAAPTLAGLFYGMQSILQLLPPQIESSNNVHDVTWTIPNLSICDQPRFNYRGMLLDACSQFPDIAFVKKQLDILSMFKMNRFHWHLANKRVWRVQTVLHPKASEDGIATEIASYSKLTDGFYTPEQIAEVVAYAKERFIEIIPGIDLSERYSDNTTEDEHQYWQSVVDEVAVLFPSSYFHIGGHEKMPKNYVARMQQILDKHSKTAIAWDEALDCNPGKNTVIACWQSEKKGLMAASAGYNVILSPNQKMHLDHYQTEPKLSPPAIGGYLPLYDVYGYKPNVDQLLEKERQHILGIQANVWTDYTPSAQAMEWRMYPRLVAAAEVAWTMPENKNQSRFVRRIDDIRTRLDMHSVDYYIPIPQQKGETSCNWVAFVDSAKLEFETSEPVAMVYTTDGSEPSQTSTQYTEPLIFEQSTSLKIRSILPSGKMGDVRTISIDKQNYAPAIFPKSATEQGLRVEFRDDLAIPPPDSLVKFVDTPVYTGPKISESHHIIFTGYINMPKDDVYYFSCYADEFWIDGQLFISNEQPKCYSKSDRSIALAKGLHQIKLINRATNSTKLEDNWMDIAYRYKNMSFFVVLDPSYYYR